MSDVFSDMIRQRLREGYRPRDWRKLRHRAFIACMSLAALMWAAGGLMSAVAALWHLAGQ